MCVSEVKKPEQIHYRHEYNLGREFSKLNLNEYIEFLNKKIIYVLAPSKNLSPGEVCPIIVSAKHFDNCVDASQKLIVPALWGLVPRWHKGNDLKHGLTTNNARIEQMEMKSSKLYCPLLSSGKRCVIPIEGFYEWQTTNPKLKSSQRPVYFIYEPQSADNFKSENKLKVNLMYMAGLFDVWHDESGESLYSFTVITYESGEEFNWLHHRTPAILGSQKQINNWLNYEKISPDDALKHIIVTPKIQWHKVSNLVNNSRNKSESCNKALVEEKSNLLSWVKSNHEGKK